MVLILFASNLAFQLWSNLRKGVLYKKNIQRTYFYSNASFKDNLLKFMKYVKRAIFHVRLKDKSYHFGSGDLSTIFIKIISTLITLHRLYKKNQLKNDTA